MRIYCIPTSGSGNKAGLPNSAEPLQASLIRFSYSTRSRAVALHRFIASSKTARHGISAACQCVEFPVICQGICKHARVSPSCQQRGRYSLIVDTRRREAESQTALRPHCLSLNSSPPNDSSRLIILSLGPSWLLLFILFFFSPSTSILLLILACSPSLRLAARPTRNPLRASPHFAAHASIASL